MKNGIALKSSPNSDIWGALASGLCIIHCLVTPFLFAARATATASCAEISPLWWQMIDYLFLIITYWAIHHTAKSTSLQWLPLTLYLFSFCLAVLIINQSFHFIGIPHAVIYIPAVGLSILHLYNLRHCRCEVANCVSKQQVDKRKLYK